MADRAQVTSVDAIKGFRTNLILYLSKARPTLDEVSSDMARTRMWLETDQRSKWEREVQRRHERLMEAQQVLLGAKMLKLRGGTESEEMVVRRARESLEQAEAKLRLVRKWSKDFGNKVEPLVRQLGKLQTVLSNDMGRAVAYLAQTIDTLEAYAEVGMTPTAANAPAKVAPDAAATGVAAKAGEDVEMSPTGTRIASLTRELVMHWEQTKEHWDDAKSHEFQLRFIEDLRGSVESSLTVIEQVETLLTKIKKDCE